jgi:hypothetical protein
MRKSKKRPQPGMPIVAALNRQLTLVDVPDPFEPGRKVAVLKNVSVHPAESMLSRGYIDAAQHAAAGTLRRLYEQAEIGGSAAIDYSRVRVDGGILADPLAEETYAARRALIAARRAVGEMGWAILSPIMGEGISIEQVARDRPALSRGLKGKRAEGYISGRLREALDDLVKHWGLIAHGGLKRRMVSERDMAVTGPQAEWTTGGRFGDLEAVTPRAAKLGKKPRAS